MYLVYKYKKSEFKYLVGEPFPDPGDQALWEPDGEPGLGEEEEEGGAGGGAGGRQGGDRPSLSFADKVFDPPCSEYLKV